MERLNPLNDFLFKKLFGDEKDPKLLISLLNAILDETIAVLTIEKEQLNRDTREEKLGVLDIKAKTELGKKINIEVQLLDQKNMVPRTLFYWSKLFVEDFAAGSEYTELQKAVTINLLDFELKELVNESYHTKYQLHESQSKGRLTDILEVHFIEFPKLEKMKMNVHNPLHRWLLFLQQDVSENLLEEVIQMDAMVNKAEDKLMKLSADPETRRQYELRAKALSDERSRMGEAREAGIEQGMKQGMKQGIQQGMKMGILEMVKSLLETGMPLAEVAKHTPYTEEELRQLLRENED
ncbi:Rpn family recombination-promoting nuclease/putative transposase [Neobacillus sp. SM06]|uniref:Rpn family recombination-promoting nuclease/putative transposase n=1 Tax=Neobacillus sp. SM06 TaxID=3422492 RepID=UPI003D2CB2CC